MSGSPREAGWYPDQNDPQYNRYWNGRAWTARRQLVDQQPKVEQAGRRGWRPGRIKSHPRDEQNLARQQKNSPPSTPPARPAVAVVRQPVSVPSAAETPSEPNLAPDDSVPVTKPAKARMPVWLWIIGGSCS